MTERLLYKLNFMYVSYKTFMGMTYKLLFYDKKELSYITVSKLG